MHAFTYIHTRAGQQLLGYTYIHTQTYIHTYIYITHMHTCIYIHTYKSRPATSRTTHLHTYMHMRAYMHTYIRNPSKRVVTKISWACIRVYVHVHAYVVTFYVCERKREHGDMFMCMHTFLLSMYVRERESINARIHTIHIRICVNTCKCVSWQGIHVYTYAYMDVNIHTYIHTYTTSIHIYTGTYVHTYIRSEDCKGSSSAK
jgi:hypothetical protein